MHEALTYWSANPRCCMPRVEPPEKNIASQGCMSSLSEATPMVAERAELECLARSTKTEHRSCRKAQIVLMAADGVARAIGCALVLRDRYGVEVARALCKTLPRRLFRDRQSQHEVKYAIETDRRILALLDTASPESYANWTGPLIAKAQSDVHVQHVWRFLRAKKIDLSRRKSWCESDDPEFAAKAAELVGLYMAPPENAIILAVDEKPSIQAPPSRASRNSSRTSTPSSNSTIKTPNPSSGPSPRSTKSVSDHVSRTHDSGY